MLRPVFVTSVWNVFLNFVFYYKIGHSFLSCVFFRINFFCWLNLYVNSLYFCIINERKKIFIVKPNGETLFLDRNKADK